MEQNTNKTTPLFTGTDIVALLVNKLRAIICISLIIAIVAGGVVALFQVQNLTYGNTVDFYLSKIDETKSLLPLLQSESFAEKLLLDEYGLPEELAGTGNAKYERAKAAVVAFNESREILKKTRVELSRIEANLTTPRDPETGENIPSFVIIQQEYESLCEDYEAVYDLLATYKGAYAESTVTEQHQKQIEKLEIRLDAAREARDAYKEMAYTPALRERTAMEVKYLGEYRATADLKVTADKLVEEVLVDWRADSDTQSKISAIVDSLTFVYATPAQSIDEAQNETDKKDEEDMNISFLKVSVSLVGDEELANLVLDRLKTRLPEFAEVNIDLLSKSVGAECSLISPFSRAKCTGLSDAITTSASIAIVAFIATAVILCVVYISLEALTRMGIKQEKKARKNSSD